MDSFEKVKIEESKANKPHLAVLPGGKDGPPGSNWLTPLPINTCFLCQLRNSDTPVMEEWHIVNRLDTRAVLLFSNLNKEEYIWVCPIKFCKKLDLVGILKLGE